MVGDVDCVVLVGGCGAVVGRMVVASLMDSVPMVLLARSEFGQDHIDSRTWVGLVRDDLDHFGWNFDHFEQNFVHFDHFD